VLPASDGASHGIDAAVRRIDEVSNPHLPGLMAQLGSRICNAGGRVGRLFRHDIIHHESDSHFLLPVFSILQCVVQQIHDGLATTLVEAFPETGSLSRIAAESGAGARSPRRRSSSVRGHAAARACDVERLEVMALAEIAQQRLEPRRYSASFVNPPPR